MILWLGRWLVLDLALTLAAGAAGIGIVREMIERRPLPAFVPPEPGPRAAEAAPDPVAATRGKPGQYGVIATRNLFAASRGEPSVAVAAPAGFKPILHGVVIDGKQSRAYLDDPVAKRVFGYAVGDAVAGGRLEKIQDDRVLIRVPEGGVVEVLLQDPSKPQADAPTPPGAPAPAPTEGKGRRAAKGGVPEAPGPVAPASPSGVPGAPNAAIPAPPGADPVPPPAAPVPVPR